jgi:hypothetical protein
MKKEFYIMAAVILAFVIREVWTLKDFPSGEISPFPFSKQGIYRSTYVWMVCLNLMVIVFLLCLHQYSDKAKLFFQVAIWLQLAEIVEFILNYNQPWIRLSLGVHHVPINVTTLRYVVLFIVSLCTFIWRT